MRAKFGRALTLAAWCASIAACGQDSSLDQVLSAPGMAVPVALDFGEADAQLILEECEATSSAIIIQSDNTAKFEPSTESSIDTAACVIDKLILSGRPPLEDFPDLSTPDAVTEAN